MYYVEIYEQELSEKFWKFWLYNNTSNKVLCVLLSLSKIIMVLEFRMNDGILTKYLLNEN